MAQVSDTGLRCEVWHVTPVRYCNVGSGGKNKWEQQETKNKALKEIYNSERSLDAYAFAMQFGLGES